MCGCYRVLGGIRSIGGVEPISMDYTQDTVNRAYQLAQQFGSEGELSLIELAERVVREGMPHDLADQAANDVIHDLIATKQRAGRNLMMYGLIVLAIGVALMLASYFVIKVMVVIPVGFIFFGIVVSLAGYSRSKSRNL